EAARIAGFDATWELSDPKTGKSVRQPMRLLSEPVAVALAAARERKQSGVVAVINFGAGHFDVAVLDVEDGIFQVKATGGDPQLGGRDFDQTLVDHAAEVFKRQHGFAPVLTLVRLREAAESAKKVLSERAFAEIDLSDVGGRKQLQLMVNRDLFDELTAPLLDRCRATLLQILRDARLKPGRVDEVILAGGMTRMPRVRHIVREVFGREGVEPPNVDELAARGAALLGAKLLEGSRSDLLLIDVVPMSLGIEVKGGKLHKLIEKNTPTPAEKKQIFSTAEDNQSAVTVSVYQGEEPMVADNQLLGQFNLESIPRAPRGVPQIEVTFSIDAGGQLHVSAKDLGSGKQNRIRVEGTGRLSDAEIERMRREVEQMVG
ncbi:MAG TPA: Hsp70 family protein, partial [Gemmataceae bacterium]|nr:Hsp70 family protein [Gemmataceae bacterium]